MALDTDAALRLLSESAPELRDQLQKTLSDWAPESPPLTILMGELGARVATALGEMSDERLSALADAIERLLTLGNDAVKEATATGFLESLVHRSARQPDVARMVARLGAAGQSYVRAWDEFTGISTPGLRSGPVH